MRAKANPLLVVALVIASTCGAAHAAETAQGWSLRGQAMSTDYEAHDLDSSISGTSYLDLSGDSGFQLAAEYRGRPRIGWELSAGEVVLDSLSRSGRIVPISFDPLVLEEQITVTGRGSLAVRPIAAALLLHPWLARRVDAYAGPTIGVALFDAQGDARERDPEPLYGGKVGVEVRLGTGRWSAGLELRHLEILHERLERDLYGNLGLTTAGLTVSYHLGPP